MPNWTLGELMSNATARIGHRADISASVASFWVNAAYAEVAQAFPHRSLESTAYYSVSSGQSQLSLPANFLEPVSFSEFSSGALGSARTISPVAISRADAEGYFPVGDPKGYYIFADTLQLWPSIASSYNSTAADSARSLQLRFRQRAEDLVSTSSVPSVDTEWRQAVLYLSEAFLHEYVGNEIEGANARARYAGYAQQLKDSTARRQSGEADWRASLTLRGSRYGGSGGT